MGSVENHQMRCLYMTVMSAVIAITALLALFGRAEAQTFSNPYSTKAGAPSAGASWW
jgi:hypothetical protein